MKKMALASLMILLYFTASATKIDTFFEGQILHVTAHSGLKMRILPGMEHEHIKVIPYGDPVNVVYLDGTEIIHDRIEWTEGYWITVAHGEDIGYVFDGYLTPLSIPVLDFEYVQFDLDLIYPLESWAAFHLMEVGLPDTLSMTNLSKVTHRFNDGQRLVKMNAGHNYKSQLVLSDIRIMDAYHLLESMLTTNQEIDRFREKTIFIESRDGHIQHIKINLDNPVDIKLIDTGHVSISIRSTAYECSL